MKKNLFSMLVISVLALAFVGCANPAGGSYPAKYTVGDIILNDGSKVNYETAKTFTGSDLDGLKSKAIAVIFRADTASKKALGVGLKHDQSGRVWCISDAKAYDKNIETIKCPASGDAGNLTFTDDTDGSDNLEQIASFLTEKGLTDDTTGTDADTRYPAFYFAKNYKTTATNLTSAYENGWYLPTVAELFDIWKVKATVDGASNLCGGSQFDTNVYWSSSQSQSASVNSFADLLGFGRGAVTSLFKDANGFYVCAVRAFN